MKYYIKTELQFGVLLHWMELKYYILFSNSVFTLDFLNICKCYMHEFRICGFEQCNSYFKLEIAAASVVIVACTGGWLIWVKVQVECL